MMVGHDEEFVVIYGMTFLKWQTKVTVLWKCVDFTKYVEYLKMVLAGRISVKWLLFFSLSDTLSKQNSVAQCDTNLWWILLINCWGFFQHFILNAFELHPFGVEMVYNKKTRNLTNKMILLGGRYDCVSQKDTLWPLKHQPAWLFLSVNSLFSPGPGQPFPGRITPSMHTRFLCSSITPFSFPL